MLKASSVACLDVYRKVLRRGASDRGLVLVGRLAAAVSLVTAVVVAPQLTDLQQAFQFIQEYTGFVTPGVMAIFLAGLFWKRATSKAALVAALATIPVSALLKFSVPRMGFLNRMGITFALLTALLAVISVLGAPQTRPAAGDPRVGSCDTPALFNVLALLMLGLLAALYIFFI